MNVLYSLIAVLLLVLVGAVAGRGDTGRAFIAVAVPYAALAIFLAGFCYRVLRWAWTPVPFRIPTTCGQQKSLPWVKASSVDNPSTVWGVLARMSLEVLAFRSLFRNNQARLHKDRLVFSENKYLWLGALAFHWSLLIILLRHLRLLVEPVRLCPRPSACGWLLPNHHSGSVRLRRDPLGCTRLPAVQEIAGSAGPLHFFVYRLLGAL